jgi:hypothetical protein
MGFGNKFVWQCDEPGCTMKDYTDVPLQYFHEVAYALSSQDWLTVGTKCYCPTHAAKHRI